MKEVWDAYNIKREKLGHDVIRGEKMIDGEYHIVCGIIIRHVDGTYLLMQRDINKDIHPGKYEITSGGSAFKGEDSLMCIRRELYEETGLKIEEYKYLKTIIVEKYHSLYDQYIGIYSGDKDKIIFQKGETISYKWANEEEIRKLYQDNKLVNSCIYRNPEIFSFIKME